MKALMIYYLSKVSQNSLLLNIVMIFLAFGENNRKQPISFSRDNRSSQSVLIFGNRPKISQFAITDNAMHYVLEIALEPRQINTVN